MGVADVRVLPQQRTSKKRRRATAKRRIRARSGCAANRFGRLTPTRAMPCRVVLNRGSADRYTSGNFQGGDALRDGKDTSSTPNLLFHSVCRGMAAVAMAARGGPEFLVRPPGGRLLGHDTVPRWGVDGSAATLSGRRSRAV